MKTTIRTWKRYLFNFEQPKPGMIDLKEIAHSLSKLCRFTGHNDIFYSVAQHSIEVARMCPPKYAMWGLLHDAAEAYMNDVNAPLKHLINGRYNEIETNILYTVHQRWYNHLVWPIPKMVKIVDRMMANTEAEQHCGLPKGQWGDSFDIRLTKIFVPFEEVEAQFIEAFKIYSMGGNYA